MPELAEMEDVSKLRPIGVFGRALVGSVERETYLPGLNALDLELREKVASYLRTGAIVFAIMEHTYDVVGGRFGVPGGSGIASDGTYYWRQDTPNYVETYGLAIEPEAIDLMRSRDWVAPSLSQEEVLEIDQHLYKLLNG